ncbi:cuticle protein 10.9-like [Centruroides vittatus]|uniref:cuticle protein 10.9-like n=1 Tax=Centruroides vittatus TaxID=120091 RepID=UPI00350F9E9A
MFFQVIFVCLCVALALAGPPPPFYDRGYYGPDKPFRYAPRPYDFGYETKDEFGATQNRQESSDGVGVKGSYGYTDPFGIFRQVDYIADEFGFRAKVRTNEPGTANQDPADVLVDADPVPGPVGPVRPFRKYGPRPFKKYYY